MCLFWCQCVKYRCNVAACNWWWLLYLHFRNIALRLAAILKKSKMMDEAINRSGSKKFGSYYLSTILKYCYSTWVTSATFLRGLIWGICGKDKHWASKAWRKTKGLLCRWTTPWDPLEQFICVSNELTSFPDVRLTRSFLLLIFLGAERKQKLRFSGNNC